MRSHHRLFSVKSLFSHQGENAEKGPLTDLQPESLLCGCLGVSAHTVDNNDEQYACLQHHLGGTTVEVEMTITSRLPPKLESIRE